jgi:TPR repeat protein
VDARDDHAMTVALHRDLPQAVEKLARRENDNDPHHNYLIGLAYLAGIDVEVDGQRARLLLEEAAAGGHVEAAEKLADMYRIGNGVSQNTDMTLKWLAKAVELRTDAYHREPSLLNLHLLYVARHQYGDVLREEGKLPDAWKNGSVTGIRARGNVTIDMEWKDGKVTSYKLTTTTPNPESVKLIVNGETKTVTPQVVK